MTSFDWLEREHIFTVSTTSELVWLDERYVKKSLLSFKHNRAYDRSLNVRAVQLGNGASKVELWYSYSLLLQAP